MTGGDGNDTLIGDSAFIDSTNPAMPNTIQGFLIVHSDNSVEASLGIELAQLGNIIVPMLPVVPGSEFNTASVVLPHMFEYSTLIPSDNSLQITQGEAGKFVPYVSVVSDFGHHLDLLKGNDTLNGNNGNDTLVGDDMVVSATTISFDSERMLRIEAFTHDLLELVDAFADMVHHQYPLMVDYDDHDDDDDYDDHKHKHHDHHDTTVIDSAFTIAGDTLFGGLGNDVLVGDDSYLIAPTYILPANLANMFEHFQDGMADVAEELTHALRDLLFLEHSQRDTNAIVEHKNHTHTVVEHHVDLILIGNDVIEGGDNKDYIVGDNFDIRIPTVQLEVAEVDGLDSKYHHHHDHDDDDHHHKHSEGHHSHGKHHGHHKHYGNHGHHDYEKWWKSWGHDKHHDHHNLDVIEIGADRIDGGAGDDLVWGDNSIIHNSTIVKGADLGKREYKKALHAVEDGLEELINAANDENFWFGHHKEHHGHHNHHDDHEDHHDKYESYSWLNEHDLLHHEKGHHHEHEHKHNHKHHHDHHHNYGDLIVGGEGDDVLFGQWGDDTLYGDTGKDWLIGGEGHDHLNGGEGKDKHYKEHKDSKDLRQLINNRTPIIEPTGELGRFFDTSYQLLIDDDDNSRKNHHDDDEDSYKKKYG